MTTTTARVLDFGISDNHRTASRYGASCWNVGLPDGREAYLLGDALTITDGVLTVWSSSRKNGDDHDREPHDPLPLLILAPGAWTHAYAASALDGAPVGVSYLASPKRDEDDDEGWAA